MDNNCDYIKKATILVENGSYEEAYRLIKPLINQGDPEALYLFSTFSIDETESIDNFEKRSFRLIEEAANKNLPKALYTLGVIYETGDGVKSDIKKASTLFKKAALLGHSRSKLSYGLDLYYGSNGVTENKCLGIKFIREAVDESVEGAHNILKKIEKEKH